MTENTTTPDRHPSNYKNGHTNGYRNGVNGKTNGKSEKVRESRLLRDRQVIDDTSFPDRTPPSRLTWLIILSHRSNFLLHPLITYV